MESGWHLNRTGLGGCGGDLLHMFWPEQLGAYVEEINGDDISRIFFPLVQVEIPTRYPQEDSSL